MLPTFKTMNQRVTEQLIDNKATRDCEIDLKIELYLSSTSEPYTHQIDLDHSLFQTK
jgi:hypothetical protein